MKSAIYIEDGTVQLILTPSNTWEKNALTTFKDVQLTAEARTCSFYHTQGGYIGQGTDMSMVIIVKEVPIGLQGNSGILTP